MLLGEVSKGFLGGKALGNLFSFPFLLKHKNPTNKHTNVC